MLSIFRRNAAPTSAPATANTDTLKIAPRLPTASETMAVGQLAQSSSAPSETPLTAPKLTDIIPLADQLTAWPPTPQPDTAAPLSVHPAADLFPMIEGREFDELVASIKKDGQLEPILLTMDNKILDGRNRYRACLAAGVEPKFKSFPTSDESAMARMVASLNINRRHLNEAQRGMIAAQLSKSGITIAEASAQMAVSPKTTNRARTVLANAPSNVVQLVRQGKMSVNAALLETQKPKAPPADKAISKALHAVERALTASDEISADVLAHAAAVGAMLTKRARRPAVA